MSEIRRADPAARRQAIAIVVAVAVLGATVIAAFDRYRTPLAAWILAGPAATQRRAATVFGLLAVLLATPLAATAAYLWRLGARVARSKQYPPPGLRVLRDTPVVSGALAEVRGRLLKLLAALLLLAGSVLLLLLWRVVVLVGHHAA